MEIFKLTYPRYPAKLLSLVNLKSNKCSLELGTGYLEAGVRMPDTGTSAHPRHEVSVILEGELETTSEGITQVLRAGDIVSIPALQAQSSVVTKNVKLMYVFFGADKNVP